jgi:tetratricopeptide (TPR) repeat protein
MLSISLRLWWITSRIISTMIRGTKSTCFKLIIVWIATLGTVIGLSLIPGLLLHVKAENNVISENSSLLVKEGTAHGRLVNYDAALANKGIALDELGNHAGAIVYFDKALTVNPHNVGALSGKGASLDNLANHTGAIEYGNT